jgi:hypothetical protein
MITSVTETNFTYEGYSRTITSKISLALAERIADAFEAAEIRGPNDCHPGTFTKPSYGGYVEGPAKYLDVPRIVELVDGLPEFWGVDVNYILGQRTHARINAAIRASYELVEHPGIRAYLLGLDITKERGLKRAEPGDLRWMIDASVRKGMANGKPVFNPQGDRLTFGTLEAAIHFRYSQEAYADHHEYAIGVTIPEGANLEQVRSNLAHFCECLRSHNGWAGSGSNWGATLHQPHGAGAFVIFNQRSSIAD